VHVPVSAFDSLVAHPSHARRQSSIGVAAQKDFQLLAMILEMSMTTDLSLFGSKAAE